MVIWSHGNGRMWWRKPAHLMEARKKKTGRGRRERGRTGLGQEYTQLTPPATPLLHPTRPPHSAFSRELIGGCLLGGTVPHGLVNYNVPTSEHARL